MGGKERGREIGIQEALSILRRQQGRDPKGTRTHRETMAVRSAKIRALQHDCGRCKALSIKIKEIGREKEVALMCRLGKSPAAIHLRHLYDLGKVPTCDSFIPFEQEE